MENQKILEAHERQLKFSRLLAKIGRNNPLGKLICLRAYFLDLPVLTQQWRDYLYVRKEQISDKFLGLDQAIIHTSYADAKRLVETVPQQRDNYLGPLKINARSFFLGNPLSLGTNGNEHAGIRALFFHALPKPEETTEVLATLANQGLASVAKQGTMNVKTDLPKIIVALLHELVFNLKLSEAEIAGSAAYSANLGLATVPNIVHNTLLRKKTQPHIQHRQRLIESYKKSPKYQEYLAFGATHQLNEQQVANSLFDMIHVAGTAGTSDLLASVFSVLCQNEPLRANVISEIDAVWNCQDTPNAQTLAQLQLTEKVILETARLYPPVRFLNQMSTEAMEVEIGGQRCPFQKGTRLVASVFTAHRDPKKYESPDTFKTTRDHSDILSWNGSNPERNCPGRALSIALVKLFCLYALKHYQWRSFSGGEWDMKKFAPFKPNLVLDGFARRSD
ncbi:cytochrome P450 [Coleofasciculus sp. G2-EDA-02]|uniref:cytochrome P450 n=1 Tax=Coleofasciculus sp. G2-EDA-02 TaxID=3069529 RepID=UPI0032F252ED